MKMEKEKSTGSSSTRIMSTSSSLEMWICSLPQVSMYLHNLSPRWPWNIHMQSVASLEHQDQYLWIQIPTAHQKFLRVWIEVCEMVRKVRSIFTCSKYLRKTKFRPRWICNLLLLSSGLCCLDFCLTFSCFTYCNWYQARETLEGAKELSEGSHGKPAPMRLPSRQRWVGHSVKTARENLHWGTS